jgi:Tat protein translocase TatC
MPVSRVAGCVLYLPDNVAAKTENPRPDLREHDESRMTLGEHLEELRKRLAYALIGLAAGLVVALVFGREIIVLLQYPYDAVMRELGSPQPLRVLAAQEGFLLYMKVCLIAGLILSSAWVFYQLWAFVSTGLYPRERRYVKVAVPFSAGLFVFGALFFLFVVAKPIMLFFIRFNDYIGLANELTLKNHINMMVNMMLVFGLGFQLPVVVALLGLMGLVTTRTLSKYRRYVIVGLFVFAALMTSPSPVDQILLAAPMWLLYELGVLLVWMIGKKRAAAESEEGSSRQRWG